MRALLGLVAAVAFAFFGSLIASRGSSGQVWTLLGVSMALYGGALRREWRTLTPFAAPAVLAAGTLSMVLAVGEVIIESPLLKLLERFMVAGLASLGLFLPGVFDALLRIVTRRGCLRDAATACVLFRNNLLWTARSFGLGVRIAVRSRKGCGLRFATSASVAAVGRVPQTASDYLTSTLVRRFSISSTRLVTPISSRALWALAAGSLILLGTYWID